jgi:hypothetical protein
MIEWCEISYWQIVLKKSVFADDWKFSGLLVRLACCDVRDRGCRARDRQGCSRFTDASVIGSGQTAPPCRGKCDRFDSLAATGFGTVHVPSRSSGG